VTSISPSDFRGQLSLKRDAQAVLAYAPEYLLLKPPQPQPRSGACTTSRPTSTPSASEDVHWCSREEEMELKRQLASAAKLDAKVRIFSLSNSSFFPSDLEVPKRE